MSKTVEEGLRSQVRNIEARYGRPISDWIELISGSGKTKHSEIVAMLKEDHGMAHAAAHRVALVARDQLAAPDAIDPLGDLYAGKREPLRPIHERLMAVIQALGPVEVAPKKGYLSLRRKKQFAMIQPAAQWVNVGVVHPALPVGPRAESAANFNALFTHRVRVRGTGEVDEQLVRWLTEAYELAG
jgi:Domain of unknown function (DUF5655)/Domain of unknown function (DUF4287)